MTGETSKPVIFLAFANEQEDRNRYLRKLGKEIQQLQEILEEAERNGLCELMLRSNATIDSILGVFRRNRGRIAVFHFGGHADSYHLLLESSEGKTELAGAGGLAAFLGEQTGLQLVFLNGCSTQQQVDDLLKAKVSTVIATSRAIDDQMATDFATQFYQSLGGGAKLITAYNEAASAVQIVEGGTSRQLYRAEVVAEDRFPWELYPRELPELVAQWNLPDAVGNPLFGLPPLPEMDLPDSPFRHLHWFDREHAEVFFGRGYQIRVLYDRVTAPKSAPITLFYGQSGVGKSSLLAAGLRPRLEKSHTIRYLRREQERGLLGALKDALLPERAPGETEVSDLAETWLALEAELGKPLVVILDQVEEVYTRPQADQPQELADFLEALKAVFADPSRRPKGKLILGFRKEWLAELERQLIEAKLPCTKVFLERLDRRGIVEAVTGPTRTGRLRDQYGLTVEEGLPEIIADDLLEDRESPVAPTLQILLTKMWERARQRDYSQPGFDLDLYQELKKEGILLGDFLDQQLDVLRQWQAEVVDSGLALDVLAFHTAPLRTAEQRTEECLQQEYSHREEVLPSLVQKCKDEYLLVDPSQDELGQPPATRLSHDTLAPLVRQRFEESDRPGQRARRILENRAVEWADDQTGAPLYEEDLRLVEAGAAGMRSRTEAEERLLQASRAARDRRKRIEKALWSAAVVAVLLILLAAGIAGWQWRVSESRRAEAEEARAAAEASELNAEARRVEAEQAQAEAERQANIARSRQLATQSTSELGQNNYELALLLAIEAGRVADTTEAFASLRQAFDHPGRTLVALSGHKGEVLQAAWSADESRILTASSDGTARVWDAESGQELITLPHKDKVVQAVWNADGSRILTASKDGTARVWDADNGEELLNLAGHTDWMEQAVWNADETRILTFGCDQPEFYKVCVLGVVKVWDADSGRELLTLASLEDEVKQAVWNTDGSRILTASSDGIVRVWDAESGQELVTLTGHEDGVNHAVWSADGSRILTASRDGTARVWDADNGKELLNLASHTNSVEQAVWNVDETPPAGWIPVVPDANSVEQAVWNVDETRILTFVTNGTVRVWNAESGQELLTLAGNTSWLRPAVWNADETRILAASDDKTVKVWDAETGKELITLNHTGEVLQAVWNSNGTRILTRVCSQDVPGYLPVDTCQEGTVKVWDANSGDEVATLAGHTDSVDQAVWNADGTRILTASSDGTARVWDVGSSEELPSFGQKVPVWQAVWNADGSRVMTHGCDRKPETGWSCAEDTVRVWDPDTGEELFTLAGHEDSISRVVWNADGSRVMTHGCDRKSEDGNTCTEDTVRVWDADTGKELFTLAGHEGSISEPVWNADETRIVTVDSLGTVRVWDAASGEELATFAGSTSSVYQAVWNSDRTRFFTASGPGPGQVWDVTSSVGPITLIGPTDGVRQAVWNADDTRILAVSDDGRVRVWDAQSGEELLTIADHEGVSRAVWNADETRILTTGSYDPAQVWDAETGQELLALASQEDVVWQAIWNADGSRILTVSRDGITRVWDAESGQELVTLGGYEDGVWQAVWNADETQILTVSCDRHGAPEEGCLESTVRVFDAATGEEIFTLGGYADEIVQVVWNADETRVLTVHIGGKVRQYFTRMKELVDAVCQRNPRNMTWDEWNRFMDGPYRPTCDDAPVPPDVVEALTAQSLELIQAGEVVTAVARLAQVLALPPRSAANPEAAARWHLAQALMAQGCDQAQAGQIEEAIPKFEEALALDPELDLDPETEARRLAAPSLVDQGRDLAQNGQIDNAIAAYEEAQDLYPEVEISAWDWRTLCWYGSLYGHAAKVEDACEQAVALAPNDGDIRDSRGLNRALLGNFQGAVEDFEAFVAYYQDYDIYEERISKRQAWIAALRAGEDPFDEATLAALWDE